jgi:hypothetical protein
VAAWPAVALVGSYEVLMMIIRGAHTPTAAPRPHDGASVIDPLGEQAAAAFAAELAADRVPSARAIRAALHVGPRALGIGPGCRPHRSLVVIAIFVDKVAVGANLELTAPGRAGEGMMYYKAAVEVVKAAKRPLTVREITDQAIVS